MEIKERCEMTIPEELLKKYKMETIDKHESPEDFYSTFLYVTRHICDEILEGAATSAEIQKSIADVCSNPNRRTGNGNSNGISSI